MSTESGELQIDVVGLKDVTPTMIRWKEGGGLLGHLFPDVFINLTAHPLRGTLTDVPANNIGVFTMARGAVDPKKVQITNSYIDAAGRAHTTSAVWEDLMSWVLAMGRVT